MTYVYVAYLVYGDNSGSIVRAPHRAMILGCSLLPVLVTLVIALIENVTSLGIAFTLVSLATSVTWGVTWALTREAVQTQAVAEQLHTVLGE
ncbi:MAG TPA: hypothetical protein PKD72_13170 [Gemmatales bacterium]|nr:hypothetical protein [Gemmatales bacterium]